MYSRGGGGGGSTPLSNSIQDVGYGEKQEINLPKGYRFVETDGHLLVLYLFISFFP